MYSKFNSRNPKAVEQGYTLETFPWSSYLEDKTPTMELFKKQGMFLKAIKSLEQMDISKLVEHDGRINAVTFISAIADGMKSPGFSSRAILVFLDIVAQSSRSSYFAGKAADYVENSQGVPIVPGLFLKEHKYGSWYNYDEHSIRKMILGHSLAEIDETIFDTAVGELQYWCKHVDMTDLRRNLHNSKFPQNTHKIGTEIVANFNVDATKFACPCFNALKPIGRAMICSEWLFGFNSNRLVRDINDLDQKEPLIRWPDAKPREASTSTLERLLRVNNSSW